MKNIRTDFTNGMSDARLHRSPLLRALLFMAGALFLVLGIVGIVLPGLPTTPFVLLSAACFLRASSRAHRWLLQHPGFGPILRTWETQRAISRRTRNIALVSMLLTGSFSIVFLAGKPVLQAVVALAILTGSIVVLRLNLETQGDRQKE